MILTRDANDLDSATVAEVASRLKVSRWTIHRWIRQGELPALKIGQTTRILLVDLAAFIEAHRDGGSPL